MTRVAVESDQQVELLAGCRRRAKTLGRMFAFVSGDDRFDLGVVEHVYAFTNTLCSTGARNTKNGHNVRTATQWMEEWRMVVRQVA
jgi:hypothetical protein